MTFAIFTHVDHFRQGDRWYAYGPYVQEMNLWAKKVDRFVIVGPTKPSRDNIDLAYQGVPIELHAVPSFSFVSLREAIRSVFVIPMVLWKILLVMPKADHLHLRCPGNIGLLAAIAQIFFPTKPKTAKYAGNWDPKAEQPRSYRLQKWLLSNTFLTRRMKALVYGDWPGQSSNVLPFFTATYSDKEIQSLPTREWGPHFHFVFAGTLSPGKQPLYALQLLHRLRQEFDLELSIYGEGQERDALEQYIGQNELKWVKLYGNVDKGTIKKAMQLAHFLILPSRSEGWPKVVAEAMWWGAIPIVTPISCVPWMIDKGKRGVLLEGDPERDASKVVEHLGNGSVLEEMSTAAAQWSRQYTLERFEQEIGKLLR